MLAHVLLALLAVAPPAAEAAKLAEAKAWDDLNLKHSAVDRAQYTANDRESTGKVLLADARGLEPPATKSAPRPARPTDALFFTQTGGLFFLPRGESVPVKVDRDDSAAVSRSFEASRKPKTLVVVADRKASATALIRAVGPFAKKWKTTSLAVIGESEMEPLVKGVKGAVLPPPIRQLNVKFDADTEYVLPGPRGDANVGVVVQPDGFVLAAVGQVMPGADGGPSIPLRDGQPDLAKLAATLTRIKIEFPYERRIVLAPAEGITVGSMVDLIPTVTSGQEHTLFDDVVLAARARLVPKAAAR